MSEREPMLSNETMYFNELYSYPTVTREELRELELLARDGDEIAKELVLVRVFRWITIRASHLRKLHAVQSSEEYLDVVSVGNLAVLEIADEVIANKPTPAAYLCAVARNAMAVHCKYRSSLIPVHMHVPDHARPSVGSLEAQPGLENIQSPIDEASAANVLLGPLHEAINTLKPKQREALVRHLGLDGKPAESFAEIDRRSGKKSSTRNYYYAIDRLSQILKRA